MPELPEVEYVRRNLDRWMRRSRIAAVRTDDARIVRPTAPRAFERALVGRVVTRIDRRGKWLRFTLDDGRRVFSHLGMTGWFESGAAGDEPRRFERVSFDLERGAKRSRVVYVDPRRWGRMIVAEDDIPSWTALGPDPLEDGLDAKALLAKLAKRKKRSIKEALMDQALLAGIGNIHAIEALWKAKIDPRSRAAALDERDVKALVAGMRWTIDRALVDLAKGEEGEDNPFRIYGRKDQPCPRCRHALARIELGGRTTTFCPGCQRRK